YIIYCDSGCVDTGVNCGRLARQCNNALWEVMMTRYCPKTCERCKASTSVSHSASMCLDRAFNCLRLFHRCSDPGYFEIMRTNCVATCGHCRGAPSRVCADKAYNCDSLAHRCGDEQYGEMMSVYCKKTCGLLESPDSMETNEIFARPEKKEFESTRVSFSTSIPIWISSATIKPLEENEKGNYGVAHWVRLLLGWKKRMEYANLI
ncbi:hypothetical protein PFISCL1PPCAC_1409, partial [Pristionchus fissidentatus]